jgi:hypothetical protein
MFIRKTIPILSLIILIACIFGTATAAKEKKNKENKIVLEYTFSAPVISSGAGYDTVRMKDTLSYQRTGAPIVPIRPVRVLIPYGKKIAACNVTALDTHQVPGTYRLAPAQKPYPLSFKGPIEETKPDMAVYGKTKNWPGTHYEQLPAQSKRGYQIFTVNLFPLQYLPTTGEISYAEKIRLEIDLADKTSSGIVKPSRAVKKKLEISVGNPDALASYPAEGEMAQMAASTSLPEGGPYQYIVITSQALKNAPGPWNFQTLCDAKNAVGITAGVVTTEWIYANYPGNKPSGGSDNQTRIRNFLIDAYQNWGTEYVLLGGTNAIVPARMFYVTNPQTTTMPVDMYYGCVYPPDCTFDNDANNKYGEPTDGPEDSDVDLYAEIYVGRAAVESADEIQNFVKKTLAYNSSHSDYLKRVSMLGERLDEGGVAEFATVMMEQIRLGCCDDVYCTIGFENHEQPYFYDFDTLGCLPDGSCWPLYDATGYFWPKENLISLMNGGIHCFIHAGHANYTYNMKLNTSDLPSLTNDDYFFVYSGGCNSGGFDKSNCFAEAITTMEHGAFAVVMNARYGWGMLNSIDGPSQRFARQFWDAALGEEKLELGRANQDSKEDNLWDINGECIRWCYYELNLFGDPQQIFNFLFPNSRGINLNSTSYGCNVNVGIHVSDIDLVGENNCNVDVDTSGGDSETVTLSQLVPGTGVFSGSIHTVSGAPNPDDGDLQVSNGNTITVTYYDADDGTGNPAIYQDTAGVDCAGPVISNVNFNDEVVGRQYQTISFQTDEDTTAKIICGKTCGSQEIVLNDLLWRQSHSFTFNNMDEAIYYFKIEVTDKAGNTVIDDNGGNCYNFLRRDIRVPADYSTIQAAIDASNNGDIIIVAEDTYLESIDLKNKDILVRSTDPDNPNVVSATIINGNGAEDTVKTCTVYSCPSGYKFSYCRVSGFTITGGNRGVFCGASNFLTISNCIITGNADIGAYCTNSGLGPLNLENCIIKDNSNFGIKGQFFKVSNSEVSDNPIGIQIASFGTVINNCSIFNNEQKGVYVTSSDIVVINNSLIYGNGNGFEAGTSNGSYIYNCTIAKNTNYGVAGGMSLKVKNCILWDNGDDLNGNVNATFCCIKNNDSGNGNIHDDPCFVNAGANNYHLKPASLCIDAGDPFDSYTGQTDIDGEPRVQGLFVVDMGADEVSNRVHIIGKNWYSRIQDAINNASSGDEIVVYPGVYKEAVTVQGKTLNIHSYDPNDWDVVEATEINSTGAANTVKLSYQNSGYFRGFTITGGNQGVLMTNGTNSTLSRCIVRNNNRGISVSNCAVSVKNCIIHNNTNEGITTGSATINITNSLIYQNNQGISFGTNSSGNVVCNNTIVNNAVNGVKCGPYSGCTIKNCILWNNVDDLNNCTISTVTYSCIEDGDGCGQNGNICSDPGFVDADFFHIGIHSPCVNVGNGSYNEVDIDGDRRVIDGSIDIGADEVNCPRPDAHWWKLDEWIDDSIGNCDGDLTGGDFVTGIFDNALLLDCGSPYSCYGYVDSLNDAFNYTSTFTISGWFNTTQTTGIQTIVGQWSQWSSGYTMYYGWQVIVYNNKVIARFPYADGWITDVNGTSNVTDGKWHHFALVYRSIGDVYLYVDGQPEASSGGVYVWSVYDTKFRIGDGSYVSSGTPVLKGGQFYGMIDDVMIFNRVLTADEVEQLYNNGL